MVLLLDLSFHRWVCVGVALYPLINFYWVPKCCRQESNSWKLLVTSLDLSLVLSLLLYLTFYLLMIVCWFVVQGLMNVIEETIGGTVQHQVNQSIVVSHLII